MSGQTAVSGGEGAVGGAAAGAAFGPYGALAGGILGAGIGIYGAIKSANDQADIERQKAALEEAQATELARREQINDANSRSAAFKSMLMVASEGAAEGHTGGSVGSQLEIKRLAEQQITLNDQAADFEERMIRAGAGMESQLADNTRTAGYINAAGKGATLLGQLASPRQGIVNYSTGKQALPSLPPEFASETG